MEFMESLQREGEEEEYMLPSHKYDNTDDILKGDKETKCVSQTLALLFLSKKLLVPWSNPFVEQRI